MKRNPSGPKTGELPLSTAEDRKQRLSAWIRQEVQAAINEAPAQSDDDVVLEIAQIQSDLEQIKSSLKEWTTTVNAWEAASKQYEDRIYQHVASIDEKVASSSQLRAVAFGSWDVILEVVVPIRKASQWVTKACLHFEALGPQNRRSKVDGKEMPGIERARWRDQPPSD